MSAAAADHTPPPPISPALAPVHQRNRLKRMIAARERKCEPAEYAEIDAVLRRACPDRLPQSSRFIGMNALTLTRDTLGTLSRGSFVFHKVNGIGALAVMAAKPEAAVGAAAPAVGTMFFIRRNGVFAIDGVALPLRRGRVLLEGELCIARDLSLSERARLKAPIPCVVGFDYLEADDDLPEHDARFRLYFAAHDLLVDDEPQASNARARLGDAVCVQTPFVRFQRLLALTQAAPGAGEAEIAPCVAAFDAAGRPPALVVFAKPPYLAVDLRLALRTLPACLHGIPLDGLIFMPGDGGYQPNETNRRLLKYKAWRDNTADLVLVAQPDGGCTMYVVDADRQAVAVSTRLWLGDTEDERAVTSHALELENARLERGGAANRPLIYECEPSVEDRAAFFALREQCETKEQLLVAAGALLRWRPMGIVRDEKNFPNSALTFWTNVDALVNCVEPADIAAQIGVK